MLFITLPPELEAALSEQARAQNTTPELLALDRLQQWFVATALNGSATPDAPEEAAYKTMTEYWNGFIGVADSSERFPEGSSLSEETGRKFGEGMVEKRKQGKL